jgi:hypothetical protein
VVAFHDYVCVLLPHPPQPTLILAECSAGLIEHHNQVIVQPRGLVLESLSIVFYRDQFSIFLQSLRTNALYYLKTGHDHFPHIISNLCFPIIIPLVARNIVYIDLQASLNKLSYNIESSVVVFVSCYKIIGQNTDITPPPPPPDSFPKPMQLLQWCATVLSVSFIQCSGQYQCLQPASYMPYSTISNSIALSVDCIFHPVYLLYILYCRKKRIWVKETRLDRVGNE